MVHTPIYVYGNCINTPIYAYGNCIKPNEIIELKIQILIKINKK